MPKNILMIGPTGVGKTEISRRLARLSGAPFIKVEATKFTEVGYVGRDVDSIIRDLAETAVKQEREKLIEKTKHRATDAAEERILDVLLPKVRDTKDITDEHVKARLELAKKLESGELDEHEIEIKIASLSVGFEIMAPAGMEEMTSQLQSMLQNMGSEKTKTRKLKIKDARRILQEEEASKMINEDEVKTRAIENVEQNGIVFIDEIDKVTRRSSEHTSGADVSREGVQRDLLPLVEGSTVITKYGMIKTDHILFIASGAFHVSKPSDLIPELQGRLPIRVELKALSTEDFKRILTEPDFSLIDQYKALMLTEKVNIHFDDDAIQSIAEVASTANQRAENIGARRLHTVMERLLETASFEATDRSGETITIDRAYVNKHLVDLIKDEDLARWIL